MDTVREVYRAGWCRSTCFTVWILLLFARRLSRRGFPIFFSITPIFLRPTCLPTSASGSKRTRPILTALPSCEPVLSDNIEFSRKIQLPIFTSSPPSSVTSNSMRGYPCLRLIGTASSGYTPCSYIGFLPSYHVSRRREVAGYLIEISQCTVHSSRNFVYIARFRVVTINIFELHSKVRVSLNILLALRARARWP